MPKEVKNFLVLTLLAEESADLLLAFVKMIMDQHCTLIISHYAILGTKSCLIAKIKGQWHEIAKLETHLSSFAEKNHCLIHHDRTGEMIFDHQDLPYTVEIYSPLDTQIILLMTDFFLLNQIKIYELNNHPFITNPLNIPMAVLSMKILIPHDLAISDVREGFLTLCDNLNIDAYLEPERA